ncbi:MAG: hypothetical protein KDD50_02605 [Bdellovibrionales bacterium]|nr:hypothetical protein [Bdellovibrionales bacterium]
MTNRTEAHRSADERYNSKRYQKKVAFNKDTEGELIALIEKIPNFKEWVKSKLQEASK